MAMAPPRPCSVPKCRKLNCQEHQVDPWRTRSRLTVQRVRGRRLQAMRAALFARSPWCVTCTKEGRAFVRAVIRDHIIPLAEGGRDDASNEQALCLTCSDEKTRAESARGVARR